MKKIRSIALWIVVAALIGWWLGNAVFNSGKTDSYPNKPITIIVPYGAGGGSDTFVRKLQIGIVEDNLLPQPLVVSNQPGGSGTIGTRAAKNARPDGYTLLCHHNAIIATKLSGLVDFGPEAFEAIALTGEVTMIVMVREDCRFEDLPAMLEEAKRAPKTVTFGANQGSPAYLATLQLERQVPGSEFSIVSADGGADRYSKILGGHLDAGIFTLGEYLDFRRPDGTPKEDNVRAMAVLSPQRHESIPHVPTSVEQGVDVLLSSAYYWWTAKGTPQEVVDYLADVFEKALANAKVEEELKRLRIDPNFTKGEPFLKRLDQTIEKFEAVVAKKETKLPNFPLHVGLIVAGLLIWVLFRREDGEVEEPVDFVKRPQLAAKCFGVLVVYVAALGIGWLPFAVLSAAAVFVIGGMMSAWRPDYRLTLLQLALLTGFGAEFIFTNVFTVVLP
ncbi:MAG: tripartite tricarboxylate transporter substrate binding protein [Verrucomicrobiota bacterium]